MAAGRGVANRLRDHFGRLESTQPNRRGWPRQHFWSDVRGTVSQPIDDGAMTTVGIGHVAIRQKLLGGDILPRKPGGFLTIPAHPDAYGHRAREFSNLKVAMARDESGRLRPALVAMRGVSTLIEPSKGKKKKWRAVGQEVALQPLFWLVRAVKQAPMPGALPTEDELAQSAVHGAEQWLNSRTAKSEARAE